MRDSSRLHRTVTEPNRRLTPEEARAALGTLNGWELREDQLHRTFEFDGFANAFAFMGRCAVEAERIDHHPDWMNVFNRVEVKIHSHALGGVSRLCVELALAMDRFASEGALQADVDRGDSSVPLLHVLRQRMQGSMELFAELAESLPESALNKSLPGIASNCIGDQLWCVVGARESFARAIDAGEWRGFSCSLTAAGSRAKGAVGQALAASADTIEALLRDTPGCSEARAKFVLGLLEHEAAHQGQLIRYLYGLKLPIPSGWKARYSLD